MIIKCVICNGSGKTQEFYNGRWEKSDNICEKCNGKGQLERLIYTNGKNFMFCVIDKELA